MIHQRLTTLERAYQRWDSQAAELIQSLADYNTQCKAAHESCQEATRAAIRACEELMENLK